METARAYSGTVLEKGPAPTSRPRHRIGSEHLTSASAPTTNRSSSAFQLNSATADDLTGKHVFVGPGTHYPGRVAQVRGMRDVEPSMWVKGNSYPCPRVSPTTPRRRGGLLIITQEEKL